MSKITVRFDLKMEMVKEVSSASAWMRAKRNEKKKEIRIRYLIEKLKNCSRKNGVCLCRFSSNFAKLIEFFFTHRFVQRVFRVRVCLCVRTEC